MLLYWRNLYFYRALKQLWCGKAGLNTFDDEAAVVLRSEENDSDKWITTTFISPSQYIPNQLKTFHIEKIISANTPKSGENSWKSKISQINNLKMYNHNVDISQSNNIIKNETKNPKEFEMENNLSVSNNQSFKGKSSKVTNIVVKNVTFACESASQYHSASPPVANQMELSKPKQFSKSELKEMMINQIIALTKNLQLQMKK